VDIHEGIENTLTLVWHEFKTRIEVQKDYGDIPRINYFLNRLKQAFMNLLVNAAHAIQGQGQILIGTRLENESSIIEIRDTGVAFRRRISNVSSIPDSPPNSLASGLVWAINRVSNHPRSPWEDRSREQGRSGYDVSAYLAGCLSTLERKYCNVFRWGLRGEIKAGGGRRCLAIFDDDER